LRDVHVTPEQPLLIEIEEDTNLFMEKGSS
jgi:hypothetical protein